MKRKEKELYWTGQINEYRESGETLVQWCEKKDIKIHTMKYWLHKQSSVSKKSQETAWISCLVEEPSSDTIKLKIKNVEIEVMSGFRTNCCYMTADLNIDHLMPWSKELPKDCYIQKKK